MTIYYAAMKMNMGDWTYYVVKLKMSEVATHISFASEVHNDNTIHEQIQRTLNDSRAKGQIVKYLQNNSERFFNSIVVAALDGEPKFFSIKIDDDPRFDMIGDDITDSFGVLRFSDSLKTYALDGQHRLKAIKELIENPAENPPPPGFSNETLSVIYVIPNNDTSTEEGKNEFLKSYRRLFSSLNRHAKPVAKNDIIIMDEDDRYAIVTRHLITEFEFFVWDGTENPIVDCDNKGESISGNNGAFCTIIGLYKMNVHLLWDENMTDDFGNPLTGSSWNNLIQDTPTEDNIDDLRNYLFKIWEALVVTLPELKEEPSRMRSILENPVNGTKDSLLFRPLLQTNLFAPLARRLMTDKGINKNSSIEEIKDALKPLSYIPSDLRHPLWKGFVTLQDPTTGNFVMASENRTQRVKCAYSILLWITGCEELTETQIEDLTINWSSLLTPPGDNDLEARTFNELEDIRNKILDIR